MFCNHKRLSSVYIVSKGFTPYNRRQTRVSLVVGRQKPENFPRSKGGKLFAPFQLVSYFLQLGFHLQPPDFLQSAGSLHVGILMQ